MASIKKICILVLAFIFSFSGMSFFAGKSDVASAQGNAYGHKMKSEFVYRKGDQLMLGNKDFKFVGTNNYYLHYKSNEMIDDVIENASDMGINVIRVWGFFDGMTSENAGHNTYMQYELGKFMDENAKPGGKENAKNAFERLDYAIKKADEEGVKLVIAMTNNWDAFGGMNQYVKWFGETNHDLFYTDERMKAAYKNYVQYLLNRTNTYTGVKYKDESAIMTWELANEPRLESDKTGDTLVKWADEMSTYVKSIDRNHLVAVGDEGFFNRENGGFGGEGSWAYTGYSGVDFDRLLALKNIDYGTYHLYPEHWGISTRNVEAWGKQYIEDHIESGKVANKPVVLEEYGITASSKLNREMIYETWNNAVYDNGGAGSMFWMLSGIDDNPASADANGLYQDYDGFRVVNDNSPLAKLLKNYAKLFNGEKKVERKRVAYLAFPAKTQEVSGIYPVAVKAMTYGQTVKRVELKISSRPVTVPMTYNEDLDYYEYAWDTTKEVEDGDVSMKALVIFTNGRAMETPLNTVTVNNAVSYEKYKEFTFSTSTENVMADGTWQASFGATPLQQENGMLKVNVNLPGKADWEEARIKFAGLPELGVASKVTFDLMIPKSNLVGGIRPYIVLNPGWIKEGVDKYRMNVNDMSTITLGGVEYHSLSFVSEFSPVTGVNELYIGIVGDMLAYSGPIYIDNVALFKKD